MFARNVALHLKPDSLSEFKLLFDKEVLPTLQKQYKTAAGAAA